MNFRKNNGFTAADASIAVIILLIVVPTIFGAIYNLTSKNNATRRKSEALNIATNIMEIAKSVDYNEIDITSERTDFVYRIRQYYDLSNTNRFDEFNFKGKEDDYYKIKVNVYNYPRDEEDEDEEDDEESEEIKDLIKIVEAKVTYKVQNKEKELQISTLIKND